MFHVKQDFVLIEVSPAEHPPAQTTTPQLHSRNQDR